MAVGKEGCTLGNSTAWGEQAQGREAALQREPGTPKTEFGHFHVRGQSCWHQLRPWEHQEPAEMSNKQRHQKTAPLQRHFQTRGPEHTTAPLLIKQLLGSERAGRGELPAMPMGLNNPKGHPKGFTSPEQQACNSSRGSEGSI